MLEEARNSTWQISVQNVICSILILILLFVSYSLISFNFYLFYFPGAAAEPLGSARGALRAARSTGWEPLAYRNTVSWQCGRDCVTYQKLVRYGPVRCAVGIWLSHQRYDTVKA